MTRRTSALTAAVAVVAALVAVNVWLALTRSDDDAAESARLAAVASARQRIPAMLSYDYRTIDHYLAVGPANTTGRFRTDFTQLVATVIAPAANREHVVTSTAVRAIGVTSAGADRVVLLVLLDQTTSNKTAAHRHDASRDRVTMVHSGGSWLIGELTPL